jgi:glycerol-3-phosphate dehydrogenase
MERDLPRLAAPVYDAVVVGGGILGACIAWDAALRGLRVALLERGDFGAATSANSLGIVHGGLRYLARGEVRRMRESIRERSALLRIAPTLVEPLPVLVPTGAFGTRSRVAFGAVLGLNDLLSLDRNRGLLPERRLPAGHLVPLEECRRRFSAFPSEGASGGALWYDARLRHPERLALALVRAAVERGAAAANYCRVHGPTVSNGAVTGVTASDVLSGEEFSVRARRVVVAAGPWTPGLTRSPPAADDPSALPQAFALNVEVPGRRADVAVGVRSRSGRGDDPIVGGHRYIFLVPGESTTLLGTWYAPWPGGDPEALAGRGAAALIDEFRAACPGLAISSGDILRCHWGLLPLKAGRESGRPDALASRERVIDHGAGVGPAGMFSAEGVKFTTARGVAQRVVDRMVASLGLPRTRCRTACVRIDDLGDTSKASPETLVRRALREEMAVRLSDLMFRRTTFGLPFPAAPLTVAAVARIAAADLGWSPAREAAEIDDVMRQLRPPGPTVGPGG